MKSIGLRKSSALWGFWIVVLGGAIQTVAPVRAQDCNGNGVQDAVEFEGRVVWVDSGTMRVQQSRLDGSNVQDIINMGLNSPEGVGLDWDAGKVYWTDQGSKKIQRANLDGSIVEDLVTTGLNSPYDIDIDSIGGKIYWTDLSNKKIQRANLDGTDVQDIVTAGVNGPRGIAVDSSAGKVYWVDNNTRKIQRANLDGSLVQDLVTMASAGLDQPSGIALDVAAGKMYWTDWGSDKIQRANLDGTGVQDLVTTGLMFPVGIAVDAVNGKIYWTDSSTSLIQRANLDGSTVETVVGVGVDSPQFIAVAPPRIDSDGDGVFEPCDTCPTDAAKTSPGACGCGLPDTDANSNGTADCVETVMPPTVAAACCAPGSFLTLGLLASAWVVQLGARRRGRWWAMPTLRAVSKAQSRALPARLHVLIAAMLIAIAAQPARAQFDVPVSSAITLNSNATTDTVHADGHIQLASDGLGHWVAVWTGTDPFGTMSGGNKIFSARSSDNGATWSPLVRADQYGGVMPSGHSNDPRIATDAQGHWIIVWDSHDTLGGAYNNRYKVMFARSDDNGATWSDMDPLNNLSTPIYNFEEEHAAIASDGAGNWIVVWNMVEVVLGAEPGVAMSRSTDNGMTWTDPVIIATEIGSASEPRIASDGQGRWVVVYHSKNELGGAIGNDWDILFVRSDDNGANWTNQAPLNSYAAMDPLGNPGADLYPDLATDGNGNWIAAWISQYDVSGMGGGDEDINYAVSADHGATWSTAAALNTNASTDDRGDQFPAIASDGQGHWIALWNSNANIGGVAGPGFDIHASRSDDNGTSWTFPALFNSTALLDIGTDTDQRAAIATDGMGNWVGAWMSNYDLDGTGENDFDILVAGSVIAVCDTGPDTDGDGVVDHCDNCPTSPNGDQADSDADGLGDACDNCTNDANADQADSDSDLTGDACDECPNDPAKVNAGVCGCGEAEADSDADGSADCIDECPNDPLKVAFGLCGCGTPDTDSDGNGLSDCVEPPDPQVIPGCCGAGGLPTAGMILPLLFLQRNRVRRRAPSLLATYLRG